MSIKLLKENVELAKKISQKLVSTFDEENINSVNMRKPLVLQLKVINDSIPKILDNVNFYKTMSENKKQQNIVNIRYSSKADQETLNAAIQKKDETKFIRALEKEDTIVKKNINTATGNKNQTLSYTKLANKLFRNLSINISQNLFFSDMKSNLKKIGSSMVLESYISLMLFTLVLVFSLSLMGAIVGLFFGLKIGYGLLIVLLITIITFLIFYFYPSSQAKNLEKSINQELPFLTIYLSAIATSGIEPSKIFSILLTSDDYPATKREIKKLMNYVNFYGTDLVTALKYVSKNTPSERLGLLFDGLATTITSGGEITDFLSKHSDTLLFDYRLEREKYTHIAETFMNIYISVVIAAPMILMVLLILMSITGFGSGSLTSFTLGVLSVVAIALLNIFFLVFLNLKQPKF